MLSRTEQYAGAILHFPIQGRQVPSRTTESKLPEGATQGPASGGGASTYVFHRLTSMKDSGVCARACVFVAAVCAAFLSYRAHRLEG